MDSDLSSFQSSRLKHQLAKLNHQLALAEAYVAQCEAQIERRRVMLAQVEREGLEPQTARDALKQFEELQKLHVADRDRLRNELGLLDIHSSDHPLAPTGFGHTDPEPVARLEQAINAVLQTTAPVVDTPSTVPDFPTEASVASVR